MADERLDNPAGRIVAFWSDVIDLQNQKGSIGTRDLLADLWGLQSLESKEFFERLGALSDLPAQLDAAIRGTPTVSDTFLEFVPQVDAWFKTMSAVLQNPGPPAAPDTLIVAMKLCSEQLSLTAAEDLPDLTELASIREELRGLVAKVVTAEMDSKLKLFLTRSLHDLLESIDVFRISGVAPIRESITHIIGSAQVLVMSQSDFESSDAGAEVGSRFWETVSRLADLVNITAGTAALAAVTLPALGVGHI